MAAGYATKFSSTYEDSDKKSPLKKSRDPKSDYRQLKNNYEHLSRELKSLGHLADAEDMLETVRELGELRTRRALFDQRHQDFVTRAVYDTLGKAITDYRAGRIEEKQFQDIFYRTQHRLSDALHKSTPKELKKKPFHSLRLTDIVNKEIGEAAALLAFILSLLFFDQARLTGMAVATASSGYDYSSLFGFLFLALSSLFFLMRKH